MPRQQQRSQRSPPILLLLLLPAFILSLFVSFACASTAPLAPSTHTTRSAAPVVLVLGSGGHIGSHLVRLLQSGGYKVLEVRGRRHIDLRNPGALDVFNATDIAYVFFLACEVGGAKFIESKESDVQSAVIQNNVLIYQTVFPWLHSNSLPYLFVSSYMQGTATPYGSIKRLGEMWSPLHGSRGRIVRLWNVYGPEPHTVKSHVAADWISSCLATGSAQARTDGTEQRQFLHVNDVAAALHAMMKHHAQLQEVSDVTSNEWVTMRQFAAALADSAACDVKFNGSSKAPPREHPVPYNLLSLDIWRPTITLRQGMRMVWSDMRDALQRNAEL